MRAKLATGLGVAVQTVRADGHGGDHDAVHVQAPRDGQHHVVPRVAERLPDEHEPDDHERQAEEDDAQTDLGLKVALVGARVPRRVPVVQPVARDLGQQHGDAGRKVKVANLQRSEIVQRRQEKRQRGVDPDDPREGEQVVRRCQEHGRLEQDFDGAQTCLPERVAEVPRAEL